MKNQTIIISILIPVFNVCKYIERCLDSVFTQISDDCEVILVDDGSTDDSGKICDLYQERYPEQCKVFHKENQGASPTRNFALDKASGDWIWFVDSDDYIEEGAIDAIKGMVEANPEIDIISAAFRRCNDTWKGEIEKSERNPHVVSGEQFLLEGRFREAYLWHHVYRLDFLRVNNIRFHDEINTQEDWLFNARAYVAARRILLSDKFIYNYFQGNPASTLSRRDKPHLQRSVEDSMKAIKAMQGICGQNKNKKIYKPLMDRLSFTLSGLFYGMYLVDIPIAFVKNVIDDFSAKGLYPIWKNTNKKSNLFISFANRRWLYITACKLKNIFI